MARGDDGKSAAASEGGNFWTSYSDLLLGLSVIFLVLFFFATIRAGVEQLKSSVAKKEAQQFMKGQIPESELEKNKKNQELVKDSLKNLEEKKAVINQSVQEVNQLVDNLNQHQEAVSELLNEQLEKAAALKVAHETNDTLEKDVQGLQKLKTELDQQVAERDSKITQLDGDLKNTEVARQNLQAEIAKATEELRTKEAQVIEKEANLAHVSQELESQRIAHSQVTQALESEKTENAKLAQSLQERESALQQRESALAKVEFDLATEKTHVAQTAQALEAERSENQKLSTQLQDQLAKLATSDQQNLQLKAALSAEEKARTLSEGSLVAMELKANHLGDVLKDKEFALQNATGKIGELKAALQDQNGALRAAEQRAETFAGKLKGAESKVAGLSEALAAEKQHAGELASRGATKDAENSKLKNENGKLGAKLAGVEAAKAGLEKDKAGLVRDNTGLARDNDGLKRQNQMLGFKVTECNENLAKLQQEERDKRKQLASLDTELKRAKNEITNLAAQRRSIASDLKKNLASSGVATELNAESGVLTLTMDEAFQFKHNSYEITDKAKDKLKKIIPIYVQNLFGKPENVGKIAAVTITGHASPSFRKKPIDPESADEKAKLYNMDLSKKRAIQIADYIFSGDIGYYPYKGLVKSVARTSGRGFMAPVKLKRGVLAKEQCGRYDCGASRRVEISFVLKGEEKQHQNFPSRVPASKILKDFLEGEKTQ